VFSLRYFTLVDLDDSETYSMSEVSDEVPNKLKRSVAQTIIDLAENSDEPRVYTGAAGKAPMSYAAELYNLDSASDSSGDDSDGDHQVEAYSGVGADPRTPPGKDLDDEEKLARHEARKYYGDVPDLAEYFGRFDLTPASKIQLCRTYANYLTQQERTKKMDGIVYGKVKKIKIKK